MNEIIKSSKAVSRTPDLIAAEINNIKEQTKKIFIYNSIEIGRRLVEAKELVSHGQFGEWLEKSVNYSQRTANNLMKIFEEYGAEQISILGGNNVKSQALANLSYTQAITLLEVPEDEREDFVKENNIDNLSTRELQRLIKEKKEIEDKLNDIEKKTEGEHKAYELVSKSYNTLVENSEKSKKETEKLKEQLKSIENKNKENLTNKEVEIENLKIHIEAIKKKLSTSENNEEIEKLQEELQDKQDEAFNANKKIKELQEQLESKPIDVNETIIEKVPEEVQKELQELRERRNEASENKPAVKFAVYFDELVRNFKDLLEALQEIENKDLNDKYKSAVSKLINKMNENL